jgi:hypothetical protein
MARAAQLEVNGYIGGTPGIPLFSFRDVADPANASIFLANSLQAPPNASAASVVALARVGALGLKVSTESVALPGLASAYAQGSVSWHDSMTLNTTNPALFRGVHLLTWSAGFNGTGGSNVPDAIGSARYAETLYRTSIQMGAVGVSGAQAAGVWKYQEGVGATFDGDLPNQSYTITTGFRFNQPISILASINLTSLSATGIGKVATFADFIGTLAWNGIVEVRAADGTLLTNADYTLTSESGLDWQHAVAIPEPMSAAFMLAGLPVIFFAMRRRMLVTSSGSEKIA